MEGSAKTLPVQPAPAPGSSRKVEVEGHKQAEAIKELTNCQTFPGGGGR